VVALTSRQVDVTIEGVILVLAATGVASMAIGTSWSRVLTAAHAVAGLTLLVLAPAKARGSVRTGLRRGRATRWVSLLLAALVLATVGLGFVHSTGIWYGVGYGTALWTHVLLAFIVFAFVAWHVRSRPDRPKVADLDRRSVLRGTGALAVGAAAYGVQEATVRAVGLAGGSRRFTGSHEVASGEPRSMPSVSWINDETPPSTAAEGWRLTVAGVRVDVADLWSMTQPVVATLDCTGGWWSSQTWDAVPLSSLLPRVAGRSIEVRSTTGYSRLFPTDDAERLYVAVGYGGQPLLGSHGGPVRLVAPGRRGPWWVKWIESIEPDERPWWLQLPFPLE
jgi:hypothetical protein